jgi:hypothetical protein
MRTSLLAFVVAMTWTLLPTTGQAGWKDFWHRVSLDFCRNNCWPEPFNHIDRQDARAPLQVMVVKGWQMQNTLGHYHFDAQTNQPNLAAERKIERILTQNRPDRRTVFVLRSLDPSITAARLDSVQQTVARILPEGAMPAVVATNNAPEGRTAEWVYAVLQKYNPPSPHLSSQEGGTGE